MKLHLFAIAFIACLPLSFASAALQNDSIDKEGLYSIFIRPYSENQWATGKLLPAVTTCKIPREAWLDLREKFLALKELTMVANIRMGLHKRYLESMGEEESELSMAAVRFEIVIYNDVYLFDRYGHLWIDARFVTAEELPIIQEIESLYAKLHANSELNTITDARIVDRKKERETLSLPIFRGFEDDRYQQYDTLIATLVNEFNAHRAMWAGATEEQAKDIHRLKPEIVKAHMIEETGGKNRGSVAAWLADPLQVNVPGDWNPHKKVLGLEEPTHRNEGSSEQNIRAAIMYLTRKGFGGSGQPADARPDGFFDGWSVALRRYNGRNDETADGRHYKDAYAERILKRAEEPEQFVPISIQLKSKVKEE
ncbi:MAG: hypothetical protein RSB74_03120 [Kiritimatiellia bacterium]